MIQRCLGDAWRFSDHTFIRILLRWTDHVTFGWVIEVKKAQDGRKLKKGYGEFCAGDRGLV